MKKRTSRRTSKRPDKNFPLLEFVFHKAPEDMAPFGLTAKSLTSVETIDEGSNGVVFGLPDGKRVLKVTNDSDEALLAKKILEEGGAVRGLPRVFYTARLPGDKAWRGKRAYAIVMEMADTNAKKFRAVSEQLDGHVDTEPSDPFVQDLAEAVRFITGEKYDPVTALAVASDRMDVHAKNLGIVRRDGRDMLVVIDLGQQNEGPDLGIVPVAKNLSERPRGFPWRRDIEVFHATLALDRVLDEGLKPRSKLGRVHATGGGPDESVSFTTDKRIATAIAIGLRTFARAARRELTLGQMIIELQPLAPKGVDAQLASMKLTPEDVVRIDNGLVPFSSGFGSWRHTVAMDVFLSWPRHELHDVAERFAGGRVPVSVSGWAAPHVVSRMQEASRELPGTHYRVDDQIELWGVNRAFEFYKYVLSYADFEKELYNPLFMHTEPSVMARVPEDQIGVVRATLDADWMCAEAKAAQEMNIDLAGMWPSNVNDWAHACENRMRYGHDTRPPSRDWDQPEAKDTVSYAWAMAEVRVYDTAMIRNLRAYEHIEDAIDDTRYAWGQRGKEVDDPLAYPYFKTRFPHLGR